MTSYMFTFYVGPERTAFQVHSELLSSRSVVFDRMINGSMQEAQTRSTIVTDLDKDAFARVCQHLYTGDYTDPPLYSRNTRGPAAISNMDINGISDVQMVESIAAAPSGGLFGFGGHIAQVDARQPARSTRLRCHTFERPFFHGSRTGTANFIPNPASVLKFHARIYAFAEKYDMPSLKRNALRKFENAIRGFVFQDDRFVQDLLGVFDYIFSDECTPDLGPGVEPLRRRCIDFAVFRIHELAQSKTFIGFLAQGGFFTRDFWLSVFAVMLLQPPAAPPSTRRGLFEGTQR